MNTMRAILIGAALIGTMSFAAAQRASGNHQNGARQTVAEATMAYADQNTSGKDNSTDRLNDPQWVASHLSADDFHF